MTPGLHKNVPYDTYAALPGVRSSVLKMFHGQTPAHARYEMLHPTDTPALIVGNATHTAVLEPELFASRYVVAPKIDRRFNEGKRAWDAFQKENGDKIALRAEEYELLQGMVESVRAHPIASWFTSAHGHCESVLYWKEGAGFGKSRLDWFGPDPAGCSTIVDLKTTRDASPRGFQRECWTYGYHLQAAWALRGADALSPVARRYVFVAVEKTPPWLVAVYELDTDFLEEGARACQAALDQLLACEAADDWPGFPETATLRLPPWAAKVSE